MLYSIDRDELPKTKEEFEKFKVMKKYERHERYPDPIIHSYIESKFEMGLSKDQFSNEIINVNAVGKNIKKDLKKGILMLNEAKEQICKSLMSFDLYKKNLMSTIYAKEQWMKVIENMKTVDIQISNEDVFDLTKEFICYEQRVDIPDPKLLARVRSKAGGSVDPPSAFMTHAFSSTYTMSLLK